MKKRILFIVLAWSLSVCSALWAEPLKVTEAINGASVTTVFDKTPQRAVSLSQFSTEMLLILGLKSRLVGTAFLEEPIAPKVAKDYAQVLVLSQKWPSLEIFLNARPDFAIGWGVAFSKKGIEAQNIIAKGVKIFVPKSTIDFDATFDTLMEDFLTLGRIFAVEDKASTYVKAEKVRLAEIQKHIGGKGEKKVFVYDSGDTEPFTVYEGFTTNLLKLVGARNILSGKGVHKTWGKASWEQVIAADPDCIIVVEYKTSLRDQADGDSKIKWLKENPRLKELKAVKNGAFARVSLADLCPGIRNVDALEKLASAIYGN